MAISQAFVRLGYIRGRDTGGGGLINPDEALKAGKQVSVSLGAAAAFSALQTIMTKLNSISLQWRVQHELSGIKPSCDANIVSWADNNASGKCYDPKLVGTIIHIVYCINSGPIGMSSMQFWTIFQGDTGLDAEDTIAHYVADPSSQSGYPPVPANSDERWMLFWNTLEN